MVFLFINFPDVFGAVMIFNWYLTDINVFRFTICI